MEILARNETNMGGLMSLVAYAIMVWTRSLSPLALVSALRETSVLLAGVLGWLAFGERLTPVRSVDHCRRRRCRRLQLG